MGDPESVAGLPGRVRKLLVELAAGVLGELDEASTPPALARIRLFAPARRAAAGAGPLTAALERDAAFRSRVAAAWRTRYAGLAALVDAGAPPHAAPGEQDDDAAALAGLFLVRPEGWADEAVALAGEVAREDDERARRHGEESASVRVRALEREVERLRADAAAARGAATDAIEELGSARREIRRLRAEADRARAAARAAEQAAQGERQRAQDEVARARAEAEHERDLAVSARERAEQAQRAGREGRSLDQARLRLLLDTVVEAATGLRRELALPPVGVRPADLVAGEGAGERTGEGARDGGPEAGVPRGRDADDPAPLAELLALPQAHLVVDGYNVTKTAYPALPLAEQRRRLVEALTALVARTGAEATCVFDGADVEAPSALRRRGVRVLFSEPGTSADELIRRLVRAEPRGRPVVVVSSDNEVAAGVRAAGARPVPAAALVRLLGRA